MSQLTDRLAVSEAALVSATRQAERAAAQHAEEVASLHTLCGVWEGRWREEQRSREEAESQLAGWFGAKGLNARDARHLATVRLEATRSAYQLLPWGRLRLTRHLSSCSSRPCAPKVCLLRLLAPHLCPPSPTTTIRCFVPYSTR